MLKTVSLCYLHTVVGLTKFKVDTLFDKEGLGYLKGAEQHAQTRRDDSVAKSTCLAEDPSTVFSIQTVAHNHPSSSFRGSRVLFWIPLLNLQEQGRHVQHVGICRQNTHTQQSKSLTKI